MSGRYGWREAAKEEWRDLLGRREAERPDPIATLRAEVEKLRVAVRLEIARMQNRAGGYSEDFQ